MDTVRTLEILGKWSMNRLRGRRRPLVAVFSVTHYCNFFCPMCPFGDPDKDNQLRFAMDHDLNIEEWKRIIDKVAPYCIWSIVEGGEPASRKDILELLSYLKHLDLPVTMISNCSLLHRVDMNRLAENLEFLCCSIDSVKEDSYCKIRGVKPEIYKRVMDNVRLLNDYKIKHYINSVITKWNTEEFVTGEYFDFVKNELDVHTVSMTFVEDRSDVNYSLLPDRREMERVCESILDYMKHHSDPMILIPSLYWKQILEDGRVSFDECGIWKSIFVNGDGSVMVPCWKYNDKRFSLFDYSIEEIWSRPEWDLVKSCRDCQVLGCIWYSSQSPSTIAQGYIRGVMTLLKRRLEHRH